MTDETRDWPDATIAGFHAMGASRYAEAAKHWLAAREALASAPMHDPRRAASEANAGVAYILLRQQREAEAALADAARIWTDLLNTVEAADVTLAGRSSSFHFRLASQNLQAFQDAERRRHARQCDAGLAITHFNRLIASMGPEAGEATMPALHTLLADIFGPRSPEVRLLAPDAADTPYADKAEALALRVAAPGEAVGGLPSLALAVAFTVLLRPGLTLNAQVEAQDVRGAQSQLGLPALGSLFRSS